MIDYAKIMRHKRVKFIFPTIIIDTQGYPMYPAYIHFSWLIWTFYIVYKK